MNYMSTCFNFSTRDSNTQTFQCYMNLHMQLHIESWSTICNYFNSDITGEK